MEGAALEEWIELHLLKAAGSAQAFLVAGGDVARRRFALGLGLGAFKDDDLAWHGKEIGGADDGSIVVLVKRNRFGIVILGVIATTEADFVGGAEPPVSVVFFPLSLAFHGETGEGDGFESGLGDFLVGDFADAITSRLDAAQRLFDFVEGVLFLGEHREGEIAVVRIAAGVPLVLTAARGFGSLRCVADGVARDAGHGVDERVAQVEEFLTLL